MIEYYIYVGIFNSLLLLFIEFVNTVIHTVFDLHVDSVFEMVLANQVLKVS